SVAATAAAIHASGITTRSFTITQAYARITVEKVSPTPPGAQTEYIRDMATESAPAPQSHHGALHKLALAAGGIAAFTLAGRAVGYKFGFNPVVRCREGHLFTTIWIPGVKLKAVDLGVARIQRCPVGDHWTLVTPVREGDLSRRQLKRAHAARDVRV